jgi:hypothetical protein
MFLMAGGKFIIGATGKFQIAPSGKFDICETCCGNVCSECPDLLPSTIEFTLAGVDITACCERAGFSQSLLAVGAPDVNGTYLLASNHAISALCGDGDTCGYGFRESSVFNLRIISGTTCAGTVLLDSAQRLNVHGRFYDDGGGIRLWVEAEIEQNDGTNTFFFFRGKTDVLTNCIDADGAVITNECPACGVDDNVFNPSKCWRGSGGQTIGDGAGTITVTM